MDTDGQLSIDDALGTSLESAKAELREKLMAGELVKCPCCTQSAKIYKRAMTSVSVRTLWLLSRESDDWHHLPTLLQRKFPSGAGRGQSTLSHWWGFMEQRERGWWRITDQGRAWLGHGVGVPKYAVLYSDRLLRLEGDLVVPSDVAKDWFEYAELMSR